MPMLIWLASEEITVDEEAEEEEEEAEVEETLKAKVYGRLKQTNAHFALTKAIENQTVGLRKQSS